MLRSLRFFVFFYGWRWRGGEQNTIHSTRSTECLFIFPAPMPFWSFRIPGEGSALSHSLYLLVLMLMHESRLEDGGWEIDHRRMSVRGTLDIHNCFSRFWAWRIRRAETRRHPRIQLLTAQIKTLVFIQARAHSSCALYWTVRDNWLTRLVCTH